VQSLVGGIKDRERQQQIRAELAGLAELDEVAELGLAVLERDLGKLLVEWRTWIGGHNRQARQILAKILVGRLTFTPKIEAGSVSTSSPAPGRGSPSSPACYAPKLVRF
jgi:hypothetical protein